MLYTTDHDETIRQDAEILITDDIYAVTKQINAGCDEIKIVDWQIGEFGDCWIKTYRSPEMDADGYAEIDGIKCFVRKPGTHPGGNAWWLEPADPVYVPVWGYDEETGGE